MREFEFIDRVMPDVPPPSPEQLASVRARMAEVSSRASGPAPRRSRPFRWWGAALAVMAVVMVIGAVALLVPVPDRQPVAATPEQLLHAAADRLASQPQGEGRYWRVETEEIIRTKGPEGYLVEERGDDVLVLGRDAHWYTWYEPVSARPYGAEATRAWQRSGSPKLCPARGCDGNLPFYARRSPERPLAPAAGWEPTFEELLALPREASALRAELLRHYTGDGAGGRDEWLRTAGVRLVLDVPSTPGTRAAAYRMLAALPGVSVLDGVRDPDGRRGIALQLPARGADRVQLVIDPGSGELWAVQHVAPVPGLAQGVPWSASIIRKAGWSDVRPVPPSGCKGCSGTY